MFITSRAKSHNPYFWKNRDAANFARKVADATFAHADYVELSAKICWDSVMHYAVRASILSHSEAGFTNAKHALVTLRDNPVRSRREIVQLEPGCAIGFFKNYGTGFILAHAMISLGYHGFAAGNKNDCIGLGSFVGWEKLDLKMLRWNSSGEGFIFNGVPTIIRQRPLHLIRRGAQSMPDLPRIGRHDA